MSRSLGRWIVAVLFAGWLCFSAADAGAAAPDAQAAETKAIRQASANYIAAIRQGDAEKIAACWTPEGDFIDSTGRAANGRELSQAAARAHQDESAALAPTVDSIRFITADVAIEDGTIELKGADVKGAETTHFTAVWVRRDGKWLLDSVREAAGVKQTHQDKLRALEWLVGDWRSEGDSSAQVEASCNWNAEKNYLLREIRIRPESGPVHAVSQRMGWDPRTKQIRIWTFDAAGGFGEGVWNQEGNAWVVATKAVTADGKSAKSVNTYTRVNEDAFLWESISAVDGEQLPNHKLRMVRKTSGK